MHLQKLQDEHVPESAEAARSADLECANLQICRISKTAQVQAKCKYKSERTGVKELERKRSLQQIK